MDSSAMQYTGRADASPVMGSRLTKAFLSLSTIAVCTKVFGFTEKLVVAHFFGTEESADVYFGVTGVVLSLIWVVKELTYPSLLPVFAETLRKSPAQSAALFRRSLVATAVFLAALALLVTVGAGPLTRLLMPGFSGPKRQMATELLRVLAPALFFLGMMMVTYTILNAHRRFVRAALPETILKLLIVCGLMGLVPFMGINALALAMGVGGMVCLAAHLVFIPESRQLLSGGGREGPCPAFHRMLLLMGPLVVGVVFSHVNGLVDNLLVSTLPTGQLSYLGYAKKLIDALLLIGPVALVTVVYSQLSHLASSNQRAEFTRLLTKVLRLIVYLTVPAGCILVALREPIIQLLFQRGHFDSASTLGTSRAFLVYSLGLSVFSLETLLVHACFATSDTRTPVKVGILCSLLDIALALALLGSLQYLSIALAFLVARTAKVAAMGALLHRRLGNLVGAGWLGFLVKLLLSCGLLWAALLVLPGSRGDASFRHVAIHHLLLPALIALSAFAGSSYLLGMDEFKAAVVLIRRRKAAIPTLCTEPE